MTLKSPIPRPGGRSARVRAAVEEAARWLVRHKPEGEITIADVAERSGVHAASIYRRWGTVPALLLDVAASRLSRESPMPDLGTLEKDLFAWTSRVAASVSGPDGPLLLRTVLRTKPAERVRLVGRGMEIEDMLDRAAARGEPRLHYTDVVDGILGPIYIRQIFGIGGFDEAYLATLVRRTIAMADEVPRALPRLPPRPPGARTKKR